MLDSPVEEIKSRLDIVEIIQEYIRLTKAGSNYKALCPFHSEKTPSFMVSSEKQIWHCFGCNEGGDIFSFVMKMEGVEFPEALRILANKANVTLKRQDPELTNQKTKFMDICKWAAEFYHKILLESSKAQKTRDYLKKRNISLEIQEEFKLGYAPDSWHTLEDFLKKRGFSEEDIFLAGLTVKKEKEKGFYDRFRDRLMFPIKDIHGNFIGFGGRTLTQDDEIAKYINTPQTLIYNKSRVLYGIDRAKSRIRQEELAVVVEGYMDCLASHQIGVTNVVSSGGTALTEDQLKLLKRCTGNLGLAFDMDIAGEEAIKRGIDLALEKGMNLKVVVLPFGKDPDECIQKDPQAWKKAISEAKSIMDYFFEKTLGRLNLEKVEDKKKAAQELLPFIAKLKDRIEQTHWLQKLASALKVEEKILRETMVSYSKPKPVLKSEQEISPPRFKTREREMILGERLVGLALKYSENLGYIIDQLPPEVLVDSKLQSLYKRLIIYYTSLASTKEGEEIFEVKNFLKTLSEENSSLADYLDLLLMQAESEFENYEVEQLQREISESIKYLKRSSISKKLKEIEARIKEIEKQGPKSPNEAEQEDLIEKFNQLIDQLKKLS